ncbi:MAG: response regulator [Treponema sp.]|nr:response regulator [Treponema sp.]
MIINKKTFILFSLIFYLLISLIAVTAFTISARQINHSFIEQQLSIASETIRLRLASIVNSELALVRKLADTPVIRQYFLNPSDPELASLANVEFDIYLQHFNLNVVFWVNDVDKIFYSTGNEPYIVDPDDPESYWYNLTLYRTERYNFNINYNHNMQQINLWINVPVFSEKVGKENPIGMLGTGINLSEFSDFIVNAYKDFDENITPYTFNKFDEITSAANYDIVYNKARLDEHLGDTGTEILKAARGLPDGESHRFIYDDRIYLVSSIPEMEWFLAVSYPLPGLLAINQSMNNVFFSMLLLILFILIVINIYITRSETALEKQNVQLIEANKKSEIASRAKSDFLAAMSHELRTPLNTIIGFSEIELHKSPCNETRDNVTRIHQSGMHLLRIINDILDLSKLDSGKFEITPDEYDTASMISSMVDMNIIRIGSKFIQFVLEIDAAFPAKLTGDELRIKQIMNNLLSNAIKYTREGTVRLSVNNKELQANQVLVTFTVRDTGIGIRAADIDKLFDDYKQLDTRANRNVEGTGLGLSISKKIAQMMGGDITAESEYGKGSCFTARIIQERNDNSIIGEDTAASLRRYQHISSYLAMEKKEEYAAKETNAVRYTILAVDDHLNNLLLIREQLKPYGIQVDTASSGQEALGKIQASGSRGYDLILMDHMMPGMDGIETMKTVRNDDRYANIPIIVLTANALRGMKEYYLEQGFTDFIAKPVDQQTLNEVIRKQLGEGNSGQGAGDKEAAASKVFSSEIIKQRIDMLNHICAAFEINMDVDNEYFSRLIDLLESFKTILYSEPQSETMTLLERLTSLIGAAQRKDTQAVRGMLGACCQEFQLWAQSHMQEAQPEAAEIVRRLQKAILDGDTAAAGKTVKELGAAALNPAEREIYFSIYDALMDDNNEKALRGIKEWLK